MPNDDEKKRSIKVLRIFNCLAVIFAFGMVTSASHAHDLSNLPEPLASKIEAAQQACADFDNGEFALEWGAVSRVDLDGDLDRDWVLDESGFACSSAVSLYCGTGGCQSHFLVEDTVATLLNRGWDVVTFGRSRVLLLDVHGSACGGINPTPCVAARVWDDEAKVWRSVQPAIKQ
jgi:hypothetical protein